MSGDVRGVRGRSVRVADRGLQVSPVLRSFVVYGGRASASGDGRERRADRIDARGCRGGRCGRAGRALTDRTPVAPSARAAIN